MKKFIVFCIMLGLANGAFGAANVLVPKKADSVAKREASMSTTGAGASLLPTAAVLAANITVNRRKYLAALEESAKEFLCDMSSEREELSLAYVSQVDGSTTAELRENYKTLFKTKRGAEIEKRMTLCGPQKDDFIILINRRSAKVYGSQGQQRSVVLALKLAEGEISKSLTGEYPVFLLDDVLSELDETRREYILNRIHGRQVIITGCDESLKDVLPKAQIIKVENGRCL